jgi:CRISPR system Cascade subunit CasD
MTEVLLLRFDAPLLCFGGVVVDNLGVTWRMPGRAMLSGLVSNALGYHHSETDKLELLQRRLRYAARCDRAGREIVDFQTVDLSQPFLSEGWTTRGAPEGREGGTASEGTHIRFRHYLADALYTVALALVPADETPTIDQVETALQLPRRPLFIGRKCCLPSGPILVGRCRGNTLLEALRAVPRLHRGDEGRLPARWPADEDAEVPGSRLVPITDDRDWTNQIHVGRRWVHEGWIDV